MYEEIPSSYVVTPRSSSSEYEKVGVNLFKKNREAMGLLGLPVPKPRYSGYITSKVPKPPKKMPMIRRNIVAAPPVLIGNVNMNRMAMEAAARRNAYQRMLNESHVMRNTSTVRRPRHMAKKSWTKKFVENERQRAREASENATVAKRLGNMARYTQKRKNQRNAWRHIANLEAGRVDF